MEWSKNTISKSELEKKQREFMEEAMRMAKRSAVSPIEEKADPIEEKKEEKISEEVFDEVIEETVEEALEEIVEEVSEEEHFFEEPAEPVLEDIPVFEGESYGVFDKDELTCAIERGEITGEGLRQAAEILAEMTQKTEFMKKLLEEQEEKTAENGSDYGLNGFIDRHNNNCRGEEDGKNSVP